MTVHLFESDDGDFQVELHKAADRNGYPLVKQAITSNDWTHDIPSAKTFSATECSLSGQARENRPRPDHALALTALPSEEQRKRQQENHRHSDSEELKQAESRSKASQGNPAAKEGRLSARTRHAIITIICLILAFARLVTGIGAAPGMTQLLWSVGSTLLVSVITAFLDFRMNKEGGLFVVEAVKSTVVDLMWGTASFLIVTELTLAVDLVATDIHTSDNFFTRTCGRAALVVVKKEINGVIGDTTQGLLSCVLAVHPVSRLIPDLAVALRDRLMSFPQRAFTAFISGVTFESFREGNNGMIRAILEATGIRKECRHNFLFMPSGSMVANYPTAESREKAKKQLFDFSNGVNSLAIFVGGPARSMGSDTWIGDADYSIKNLGLDLVNATKTLLYEEILAANLSGSVSRCARKLASSLLYSSHHTRQSSIAHPFSTLLYSCHVALT